MSGAVERVRDLAATWHRAARVDSTSVPVFIGDLDAVLAEVDDLRRENDRVAQEARDISAHDRGLMGEQIDRADAAELAADALRRELADARAECARLGAIVEGSTTAPTIKAARAHCHGKGRGTFVVTLGDTAHGGAHCRARVATGLQRFAEQPQRWIALDAEGRPCAMPTVTP